MLMALALRHWHNFLRLASRTRTARHSLCLPHGISHQGEAAFAYWHDRLKLVNVTMSKVSEASGRPVLEFEDFEGQRLALVEDDGDGETHSWAQSPVPAEHQIRGLGPITMSVPKLETTEIILTRLLAMQKLREYGDTTVFKMAANGPVGELHVKVEPGLPPAQQGAGAVHHVAFNIPAAEYDDWAKLLQELRVPNSGPVDRFWFKSLYFREPNGVLFELATDKPGFATDESMDKLGTTLSLPPFLEGKREQIEKKLKPL